MFYQLPPVGNPICLSHTDQSDALFQVFGDTYQAHYFDSGTAALAAAITVALRLKPVDEPEVILPAYGCPDLISAAIFAGAKPVLVDLEIDRPWMDLEQVAAKISAQTVAIIAVDLFGIPERLDQLRPLVERVGAVLIEDSAQAFSDGKEQDIWQGDLVVLSFGRGKPVSLLGGGAVLCRREISGTSAPGDRTLNELLPKCVSQTHQAIVGKVFFRLTAWIYNRMVSPRLYWLPQALPFLHLGETRYQPLNTIDGMDSVKLAMLPANVTAYRNDTMLVQKMLADMLEELHVEGCGIIDLPRACHSSIDRRLLRYPLLMESGIRDRVYAELHRHGLGSSRMYPAVLPKTQGLESLLAQQGEFPVAVSFAKRLLTLPTHQQVNQADIVKIRQVLCSH